MKWKVPSVLLNDMKALTEELNSNHETLMHISRRLNEFTEDNNLREGDVHEDDLEVIRALEDAVDKFNF